MMKHCSLIAIILIACGCIPSVEETNPVEQAENAAAQPAAPVSDKTKRAVETEIKLMTNADRSLLDQRSVYIQQARKRLEAAKTEDERNQVIAERERQLKQLDNDFTSGRKWEIDRVCKNHSITRDQFMEILADVEERRGVDLQTPQ